MEKLHLSISELLVPERRKWLRQIILDLGDRFKHGLYRYFGYSTTADYHPMSERLAQVGVATGPVGLAVSWLATMTDVLQAILLVASIFTTLATGLYYTSKWLRERDDDDEND